MTGPCGPRAAAASLAAVLLAVAAGAARGQEGREDRSCRLILEPTTDSTESVSVEVEPDTYVTYVRGGLGWTCGASRMVADSAARYEEEARLEMIGSADYRDSTRTLLAEEVTYYEREDRIVAEGDVRLTRRATGSTLEGPRVEFLRVARGEVRRTVATGRPLMEIRRDTASADTAPPVRVRGDRIVLLGEEEARVTGDVVIRRPDTEARSDSAVFHLDEEVGELHGSPRVTGETWRLTGRTIRTRFEDGDLREVVAEERARASGDDFELFAPRIRARVVDREIERLRAHGEERPVAYSTTYRLSADSLVFGFDAGEIDEVRALGDASAVDVGEDHPGEPDTTVSLTAGDRSWIAADSITIGFGRASPPTDSLAGAGVAVRPPGDTATAPGAAAVDTALRTTLPPADSLRDVTGPPPGAAGDTAGPPGEGRARPAGGPADTVAAGAGGREIRVMRAVGSARAYHLLEPEDPGGRPARHYQRGREIVIHFEAGEPVRLAGKDAVGVHLDPDGEAAAPPGAGPGPPGDSVPGDAGRADTASAEPARAGSAARRGGGRE